MSADLFISLLLYTVEDLKMMDTPADSSYGQENLQKPSSAPPLKLAKGAFSVSLVASQKAFVETQPSLWFGDHCSPL